MMLAEDSDDKGDLLNPNGLASVLLLSQTSSDASTPVPAGTNTTITACTNVVIRACRLGTRLGLAPYGMRALEEFSVEDRPISWSLLTFGKLCSIEQKLAFLAAPTGIFEVSKALSVCFLLNYPL